MDKLSQLNFKHHAYLIEGLLEECLGFVKTASMEVGFSTEANPDFRHSHYETLGIDEARELKSAQSQRPMYGDRKVFAISCDVITREAQNSLLKVFEEPTAGTTIILIVRDSRVILPTLKSRLIIIPMAPIGTRPIQGESLDRAGEFLITDRSARAALPFIKKIITDKDKIAAVDFLNELEMFLSMKTDLKKIDKEATGVFEEISKCRSYLSDRAPSVKMIIEHLCLVV